MDESIKCLSDYLEEGFKNRLLAASDFSLTTDETTDISDRAEFAIFVCYVNSDSHQVTEEFLGLVEVYGSKGAEALFNLICDVLKRTGIGIKQVRFVSMGWTEQTQ